MYYDFEAVKQDVEKAAGKVAYQRSTKAPARLIELSVQKYERAVRKYVAVCRDMNVKPHHRTPDALAV